MVTPAARREAVGDLEESLEVSERRACSIIAADRSSVRYRSRRPDDAALGRGCGSWRISAGGSAIAACMCCCAARVDHEPQEDPAALRRGGAGGAPAPVAAPDRGGAHADPEAGGAERRWSTDFVHDQLANGRRFRVLTIIDDVTKECLAAVPDTSLTGKRVVREMTR